MKTITNITADENPTTETHLLVWEGPNLMMKVQLKGDVVRGQHCRHLYQEDCKLM
jgi:hypothetical protein